MTYQELAQEAAEAIRTQAWWDRTWHRAQKMAQLQQARERRQAAADLDDAAPLEIVGRQGVAEGLPRGSKA